MKWLFLFSALVQQAIGGVAAAHAAPQEAATFVVVSARDEASGERYLSEAVDNYQAALAHITCLRLGCEPQPYSRQDFATLLMDEPGDIAARLSQDESSSDGGPLFVSMDLASYLTLKGENPEVFGEGIRVLAPESISLSAYLFFPERSLPRVASGRRLKIGYSVAASYEINVLEGIVAAILGGGGSELELIRDDRLVSVAQSWADDGSIGQPTNESDDFDGFFIVDDPPAQIVVRFLEAFGDQTSPCLWAPASVGQPSGSGPTTLLLPGVSPVHLYEDIELRVVVENPPSGYGCGQNAAARVPRVTVGGSSGEHLDRLPVLLTTLPPEGPSGQASAAELGQLLQTVRRLQLLLPQTARFRYSVFGVYRNEARAAEVDDLNETLLEATHVANPNVHINTLGLLTHHQRVSGVKASLSVSIADEIENSDLVGEASELDRRRGGVSPDGEYVFWLGSMIGRIWPDPIVRGRS